MQVFLFVGLEFFSLISENSIEDILQSFDCGVIDFFRHCFYCSNDFNCISFCMFQTNETYSNRFTTNNIKYLHSTLVEQVYIVIYKFQTSLD